MKIIQDLIAVGLIIGVILFFDSLENRTKTYKNLQEAKNDSLFQRGWLPDILPPSTYDITSNTNIDLNLSQGHFYISQKDVVVFLSKLKMVNRNTYKYKSFTFIINKSNGKVNYSNQST